jgi:glyceraldehyde 3-phosphate dehydrogenase
MKIRVAINGYGRIGRDFHRQTLENEHIEVVAINSRAGAESHAHLLKYDSLYGRCQADIQVEGKDLIVNGKKITIKSEADISKIDWADLGVDVVIESTGKHTTYESAHAHIKSGAKKVLVTAPCKDTRVTTIVMGINDQEIDPNSNDIFSNASCTTNCLAPVLKVLNDKFGIENAFTTTVHAFTNDQNLHDNSHKDFRRARATTESIIPTSTGAMKAIGLVLPELNGKLDGVSLRVPVPTVSLIDVVANLKQSCTAEEINQEFLKIEKSGLRGHLGTSNEPLVSVDYRGDSRSAIVDLLSTKVIDGKMAKIMAWYDNEWGYGARVIDLLIWMMNK